jgi:hypothetical protein
MTAQAYEMYYKNNIHVIKDKALIDTPHWSYASPGVMVSSLSYAEYSRWVLKSAGNGVNNLVSDYVRKAFQNDNSTSQFSSTIDAIVRSVEAEGVESNALIFFDNLHGSNKRFKYHTADIDHAHASIGKIGDKDYKVMITSVHGSIARALLVDDSPSPELSGKIISESFIDLSKISGIAGMVPKMSGNKWAVLYTVADMLKGVIEKSDPKTENDIVSILSSTSEKYAGGMSKTSYTSTYNTVIGKSFTNIHMLNSIANGVGPDHMKNHTLKVLASYNTSALKDLVIASTVIPRMNFAQLKMSTIDYSANGYKEGDILNVLTNKEVYNGITGSIIEYIKNGGDTNVSIDDYAAVLKVTGNSVATNDEFITALKVIQKAGGKMAGDDEVLRGNRNAGIEMSNLPTPMFQLTNALRRSNKALQDTLSNRMKEIKDMMDVELVNSLGSFLGSTKIMIGEKELIVENTTGVLDDLLATRQMIDEELGDVPFMNRNDKVNVFAIKERTPFTFSTVLESKDATLIVKIASISGVETSDVTKYLANKGLRIEASDIKGTVDVIRRGVIENGMELSSTLVNKLTENAKTNNMTYALYDNNNRMLSVKDVFNKLLESTIDIKDTTMSTPEYRMLRTMIYLADNSQMSTFKYLSEGLSTETIRDLTDGKIDTAKFERLYKSKNKTKKLNKLGFLDDELMSSSDIRDIIVKENGGCR